MDDQCWTEQRVTLDNAPAAEASGNLLSALRYNAFGEVRAASGTTATDCRYTKQREEAELALYYCVARRYDLALGQFVQPDRIMPNPNISKDWDRYSYFPNNLINSTDSTGHWVEFAIDVISIGFDIYDISTNGLNWENGSSLVADVASLVLQGVAVGGAMVRLAFKLMMLLMQIKLLTMR